VPVLGPLRDWQGIWCAFGHGHLGLTGSAPTGALLGAAIAGERESGGAGENGPAPDLG